MTQGQFIGQINGVVQGGCCMKYRPQAGWSRCRMLHSPGIARADMGSGMWGTHGDLPKSSTRLANSRLYHTWCPLWDLCSTWRPLRTSSSMCHMKLTSWSGHHGYWIQHVVGSWISSVWSQHWGTNDVSLLASSGPGTLCLSSLC